MRNTVVILEAGIGALSIAFEAAGFQIIRAYEEDKKAIEIYEKNLGNAIEQYSMLDFNVSDIPDADVLACQIFGSGFRTRLTEERRGKLEKFAEIIHVKKPVTFLLVMNRGLFSGEKFRYFTESAVQDGYKMCWQRYDVSKVTGIPVRENCYCAIGILKNISKNFELMSEQDKFLMPMEEFCNKERVEDEFYYRVPHEKIESAGKHNTFLCWDKNRYVEKDAVTWNSQAVPLVRINGDIRRITHEEVLHLKGFPYSFCLENANKSWMYKKLFYSPNAAMMREIAKSLMYIVDEYSLRDSQAVSARNFENIFGDYLSRKTGKIFDKTAADGMPVDYICEYQGMKVLFQLKFYKYNSGVTGKTVQICRELYEKHFLPQDEVMVLALGNLVSETVKQKCRNEFSIIVWDVKNILWIFEEYSDIRNDFVALLNYSVNNIVPQQPQLIKNHSPESEKDYMEKLPDAEPEAANEHRAGDKEETGREFKKRLSQIKPGKESFSEYEKVCTDILKYVFADYLTLWAAQEKSNAGLYRFDLCCKVKSDTNQDFFNMLMTYFNSKYVIIEFKNYTDKITQKEIYTTEKYLYEKALRRVAILISRKGPDENAVTAIRGCLRESGKLIVCLSDDDMMNLIDIRDKNERSPAEYLEDILDELLIHLEK